MEVFRVLNGYRLLTIVLLFLEFKCGALAHKAADSDNPSPSRHNPGDNSPETSDGIEASIFVHPDSSRSSSSTGSRDAEVEVLVRSLATTRDHNPHAEGLIRASSILMEYDEDTRKYLVRRGNKKPGQHRIRHKSRKHKPPSSTLSDDYFTANDAPLQESDPLEEENPSMSKSKVTIPLKSLDNPNRRKVFGNKLKPKGNSTWIALHSPVRIYIPVRFHGEKALFPTTDKCVQCSDNITLTASRGKSTVEVPPPAISICPRLAQERGRINVAVTVGPRPGVKISEGQYPVELIIWKPGGHVYSCHYTLEVIVRRCNEVLPPDGGSVNCSDGTNWGSRCHFSCDSNYVLQGNSTVTCYRHYEKVAWSSHFPVCKKATNKALSTLKNIPCLKPHPPTDGTVVCDSNGKNVYPHGSVCQFYCYPGFLIKNLQTSSTLVFCKNGKWTPNNKVLCLATYCSEPKSPTNGSSICDEDVKESANKLKYKNGTTCHFQCDSGFVIPKSQELLNKVVCNAPHWNDSSIPECKQMIVPLPHPKDCRNRTEIANRRGFAKLKPPRFYLQKFSTSSKNFVYGKCNHTKKLAVGFYVNHCTAYNSELNTSGSCTYSVTVRENSCPQLPDIPHSVLKCNNKVNNSFPKRTICNYICDEGYAIPIRLKKFSSKTCVPKKLIWQPDGIPSCKRAEPPIPKRHSCIHQTLFLDSDETSAKIKLPRFKSSLKGGKVKVSCLLNGLLPAGNYTNKCKAKDIQLGLISSCEYNITVQVKGCPALTNVSFGSLNCSAPAINGRFPIGTLCNYECNIGTVFPSNLLQYSFKSCVDHELWNSSVIPACISVTLPMPEEDSCLDQTIEIKDLESFQIISPKFKSAVGAVPEVDCRPQNISTYDVHNISCTAFDPELRVSSSCSFLLDVQNPNGIEELSREEISCESLKEIDNAVVECRYSEESKMYAPGTLCEVFCDDGFIVPLSKRNSSFSLCLASGQWNTSLVPSCIKTEAPILISGCENNSISIHNISHVNVPLPVFITAQNTSAIVSCNPEELNDYGQYEILCTAFDKELNTSASCDFVFNVMDYKSKEVVTDTPSTVFEFISSTTTEQTFKSCQQIIVPDKGFINCSQPFKVCNVGCVNGYGFSSKHKTLQNGIIECDGTDGLWDFQRVLNSTKLPGCLGHLPNTSVTIWMSFSAEVNNCDNVLEDLSTIKASLIGINEEMCKVVDCESRLNISCPITFAENKTNIIANWTLQTAFKPPGPTEVPDYEKNIENILEVTHEAIKSASEWKRNLSMNGIEVLENSFKRGKFILECDVDGYGVDYLTDKCVECPPGFFENQNICEPCPSGQFQQNSGQTSCELCSDYTASNTPMPDSCYGSLSFSDVKQE